MINLLFNVLNSNQGGQIHCIETNEGKDSKTDMQQEYRHIRWAERLEHIFDR